MILAQHIEQEDERYAMEVKELVGMQPCFKKPEQQRCSSCCCCCCCRGDVELVPGTHAHEGAGEKDKKEKEEGGILVKKAQI